MVLGGGGVRCQGCEDGRHRGEGPVPRPGRVMRGDTGELLLREETWQKIRKRKALFRRERGGGY